MDIVISYKIRALEEALKEDSKAAEAFKRKIIESGTPIIEEVEGYNRFVWVTHLYFSQEDHSNIVVHEDHIAFNYERAELTRISGTDIWYKTTIVPYGQTVNYGFVIDDSLKVTCTDRLGKVVLDPNNKETAVVEGTLLSVVKVPQKTSE